MQRKGESKSGAEEHEKEKAFLSSLTPKKISQMREGVHTNVKATVITSSLVLQG